MEFYDVIYSIGAHCATRCYLNKLKLACCSGPFDWVTGNINFQNRIKIILNDFNNFIDIEDFKRLPEDLSIIHDYQCDYYENVRTNLKFFHDFPKNTELKKSFSVVKEKYERRINRFLTDLKSNKKVLLVWLSYVSTIDEVNAIYLCNELCKKYKRNFDFLIIEHDDRKQKMR